MRTRKWFRHWFLQVVCNFLHSWKKIIKLDIKQLLPRNYKRYHVLQIVRHSSLLSIFRESTVSTWHYNSRFIVNDWSWPWEYTSNFIDFNDFESDCTTSVNWPLENKLLMTLSERWPKLFLIKIAIWSLINLRLISSFTFPCSNFWFLYTQITCLKDFFDPIKIFFN